MKKIFAILLGSIAINSYADVNSGNNSGAFSVFPTQVVFDKLGKVQELTLLNLSEQALNTQSKLQTMTQLSKGTTVVESNIDISGSPGVIITPSVVKNLLPDNKQSIRVLAIKQDEESELTYRYFIKNLNAKNVNSTGTDFEIQYGIPIFILPKNINESYTVSYVKINKEPFVAVKNVGNVHIQIKELFANKTSLGTVGRLLAGQTRYLPIPATVDKSFANGSTVNLQFVKSGLVDFNKEQKLEMSLTK